MKIGQVYSGFQLKKEEYIDEVKSFARIFEHKKTGARLVHLENDDDNKVFSITFKTPPSDNTGVLHILEHSVLCGSKKFPIKDPFVELLKGSLNTFLNAMTWSDKTMYPVASRNDKDFFNLMEVYLDAVFSPNVCKEEKIFMQEGWHYHLEKNSDNLSLNGVVYNEMQGAYSSPERILYKEIMVSLYSDTAYSFNSGGIPEFIPDLKYKELVEFHKKYYHPSNSYIYLYGNGDIKEQLEFLNCKYLKNFDKLRVKVGVGKHKPFAKTKRLDLTFPILKEESEKDKTYFSFNYAIGEIFDKETTLALNILIDFLLNTKSAPLKKAILSTNLAGDVFGHFEEDCFYTCVSFFVKNSNFSSFEKLEEIVNKTLIQIVTEGIDKDLLEACINIQEFKLTEADYGRIPKGLVYNENCLKTWLYSEKPFEYLTYKKEFKKLRKLAKERYFEKLIERFFLENKCRSIITLKPERGLMEKKNKLLEKKLADFKKSLSKEEIKEIVDKSFELMKYQTQSDRIEDINKIPKLNLKDVSTKVEKIPTQKEKIDDVLVLYNPLSTNDICYLNLAFDAGAIPFRKLHSFCIFTFLLGKIDTEQNTYEQLDILAQKYTGGYSFGRDTFVVGAQYQPKVVVNGRAFSKNAPKLLEILFEIMLTSKFENKKRVKEVLKEVKSRFEMKINSDGDDIAVSRLKSYFSEHGKYHEYTNSITFYHFLCDLLGNFDMKWDSLRKDLEYLKGIVFSKSGLVVNVVCEKKDFDYVRKSLSKKILKLKELSLERVNYDFKIKNFNEALVVQTNVQYVAQGNNFKKLGFKYTGNMVVLKAILNMDYLWQRLRVQGGAYGADCNFSRGGNVVFSSYHDPKLAETLNVYDSVWEFLEKFKTKNMEKYIIGTVGSLDKPLTPSMKGMKTLSMHFTNLSYRDLQKERDEVLSTTQKDIRGFSGLLRALFKKKYYCILGNERKIKSEKKLFGDLVLVNK